MNTTVDDLMEEIRYQATTMFHLRQNIAVLKDNPKDKGDLRHLKRDLKKTEKTVQKLTVKFIEAYTSTASMFRTGQNHDDRLTEARDMIAIALQKAEQEAKER